MCSITNKSLMQLAAAEGMKVEQRNVDVSELASFQEVICFYFSWFSIYNLLIKNEAIISDNSFFTSHPSHHDRSFCLFVIIQFSNLFLIL